MYARMLASLVVVLAACSDASLGGDPVESQAGPDAAPVADAGPADAAPDAETPACGQPVTYFLDGDSDGYGDPNTAVDACEPPAGYVTDATDCDDGNPDVHPAATERCGDAIDNDCSGDDACVAAQLAAWTFDVDASDGSGNGHDGALRGGAAVTGGALVLDGDGDYVEVANDASFARAEGTVAVWFRVDDLSSPRGLWSRDSSGFDGGGHLSLWATDTGKARVRLQSTDTSYSLVAGSVTTGADHLVVATFGSGGLDLYVDGMHVASDSYTGGTTGNAEPIAIGAATVVSDDASVTPIRDPFAGRIYDARFYGRALSAVEIAELFLLSAP
jgi:hypothetical protein